MVGALPKSTVSQASQGPSLQADFPSESSLRPDILALFCTPINRHLALEAWPDARVSFSLSHEVWSKESPLGSVSATNLTWALALLCGIDQVIQWIGQCLWYEWLLHEIMDTAWMHDFIRSCHVDILIWSLFLHLLARKLHKEKTPLTYSLFTVCTGNFRTSCLCV